MSWVWDRFYVFYVCVDLLFRGPICANDDIIFIYRWWILDCNNRRGFNPELLKYKGPIHCPRIIIREEGLCGQWAGAAPTVMWNGTNQAATFAAKNTFDVILWKKQESDSKVLHPWQFIISGFLAGTVGPICTGPFNVVKTRLMA